jgi:hypothetical protein
VELRGQEALSASVLPHAVLGHEIARGFHIFDVRERTVAAPARRARAFATNACMSRWYAADTTRRQRLRRQDSLPTRCKWPEWQEYSPPTPETAMCSVCRCASQPRLQPYLPQPTTGRAKDLSGSFRACHNTATRCAHEATSTYGPPHSARTGQISGLTDASQVFCHRRDHACVAQSLLPHLWRDGALGGRTFDVLMTRLPLRVLHARLDEAWMRKPDRKSLCEFRAPALAG